MKQILVADSEQGIVQMLIGIIAEVEDYPVTSTTSAKEAEKLVGTGAFDIVISGCHYRDGNGEGIALRAKKVRSDTRVLLMSGVETAAKYAKTPYVDAFLEKPFHIKDIQEFVVPPTEA